MSGQRGVAEVNGTRLAYEIVGAGPTLVLIHGFTLDARMWDAQVAAFSRDYRVLRYDLRGFGRSAMPDAAPYTHADDLHALLDQLGIATVEAVIGLSMGGEVATRFALDHPGSLRALVLADATVEGYEWSAEWKAVVVPVWQGARAEGLAVARARWLAHDGLFGPAREHPALAAQLARMVEGYSGWHWLNRDPHRKGVAPARARLGQIAIPTLVLVGARDNADFQAQADLLAGGIPGARKVVLPGVGHMANMEDPVAFDRAVREFLARLPG